MRMLAGTRDINTNDFVTATLDQRFDVGNNLFDMRLVKPVLCDQEIYLIESRLFAELDKCSEIDVAVDDILHPRLRLAYIVNPTADHEGLLNAICSLHCYGIANARSHNLERVALDQDLAGRRRPGAAFRHEFTDAYVAVVLDYKQDQVTPLNWTRLDLAADCSARFGVAHLRILQECFDEIVVGRINAQHGRRRAGCKISLIEFTRQDCVGRQYGCEGGDAERNRKHDERRARAFLPEVTKSFAPDCVHW